MPLTQPLDLGEKRYWYGFDRSCLLKLLCIVIAFSGFSSFVLNPAADEAQTVLNLLCGGELNFVQATHPEIGLLFVSSSEPFEQESVAGLFFSRAEDPCAC